MAFRSVIVFVSCSYSCWSLMSFAATSSLGADMPAAELRIVFVDYLQIMGMPKSKDTTRDREIGETTAGLKELAKSENVTMVVLSQLNRGLEARDDKRPRDNRQVHLAPHAPRALRRVTPSLEHESL